MDDTRKREIAERLAATFLMVPSTAERSIRESLAALANGEDFDEQVRQLGAKLVADPTIDWDQMQRIIAARSVEDLMEPGERD